MTVTVGTITPVVSGGSAGSSLTATDFGATSTGHLLVFGMRSTIAADNNGVASITGVDTNTPVVNDGHACRATSFELTINLVPITDALEGTDDPTINWTAGNTTRLAEFVAVTGMTSTRNARSTFTLGLGDTSTGSNGSSTSPSGGSVTVSGSGAKTIWAIVGFSGTGTTISAHPSGWDQVGSLVVQGSRQFQVYKRSVTGSGTYSISGMTISASTGWAVATVAYEEASTAVANAGADQVDIEPYTTVTLNGSGSTGETTYSWTQTGGSPTVTINSSTSESANFKAPGTLSGTTLTFQLSVDGGVSTDTCTVTVLFATERAIIGGVQVPVEVLAVST